MKDADMRLPKRLLRPKVAKNAKGMRAAESLTRMMLIVYAVANQTIGRRSQVLIFDRIELEVFMRESMSSHALQAG